MRLYGKQILIHPVSVILAITLLCSVRADAQITISDPLAGPWICETTIQSPERHVETEQVVFSGSNGKYQFRALSGYSPGAVNMIGIIRMGSATIDGLTVLRRDNDGTETEYRFSGSVLEFVERQAPGGALRHISMTGTCEREVEEERPDESLGVVIL